MIRLILLTFVFSFHCAWAASPVIIAQTDSVFDDSDLADIEGLGGDDEDSVLEEEFDDLSDDLGADNFDVDDFEMVEPDQKEDEDTTAEESEEDILEDDFDKSDYEILSDRPGYEVVTDEDLEKEFSDYKEEEEVEDEIEDMDKEEDETEDIDKEEDEIEDMEEVEDETEDMDKEEDETEDMEEVEDDTEDMEEVEDSKGSFFDMEEEDSNQEEIESDIENMEQDQMNLKEIDEEIEETIEEEEELKEAGGIQQEEEELEDIEEESLGLEEAEDLEEPTIEGLPVEEESVELSDLNLITNIRYLAEKDQIVIDTSEIASYQERTNTETNQLIIEVLQAKLGENLHWPYVLRDFKTDFGLIKADQKNSSTVRVVIQLKESVGFPKTVLSADGLQIIIGYGDIVGNEIVSGDEIQSQTSDFKSILPAKTLEDLYFGNLEFSGAPVSFHVIDAPIKQVLRFISEESGLNMVIDESVAGTVTLKLEDVPWDQALHTIFKVKSLGYTRDGSVITVLPLSKIEERSKKLKEISDRQKALAPFQTKVISIMYAKAVDIEKQVNPFLTPAGNGLHKGGRIIVQDEGNTLVVVDTAKTIKKISAMAKFLDKPPQQVMVEAKIVEVTKSFARNFGFNWNLRGDLPVRINSSGVLDFFTSAFEGLNGSYSVSSRGGESNTFSMNGLPFIGDVNATLNLAQNDGSVQVLSTTKVLTKSGQSASITKNTPILIPATRTTAQGADSATNTPIDGGAAVPGSTVAQETFQTQDVQLSLQVTPIVTSSGSISLKVDMNLSNPGGQGGAFKTDRTAQTDVLTKNGQTIVISGVYQKDEVQTNEGLPWLGKIPFVGWLFKNASTNSTESEMLMFLTPTLVDQ